MHCLLPASVLLAQCYALSLLFSSFLCVVAAAALQTLSAFSPSALSFSSSSFDFRSGVGSSLDHAEFESLKHLQRFSISLFLYFFLCDFLALFRLVFKFMTTSTLFVNLSAFA